MKNEGLKYLKDVLLIKLHHDKYDFSGNDYFTIFISKEKASKIVMEINEVEENDKQNN